LKHNKGTGRRNTYEGQRKEQNKKGNVGKEKKKKTKKKKGDITKR